MREEKESYFSFKPPKSFKPPEGSSEVGKEFDMVCTFRMEEGGKLCLTKLGDTDMEEDKEGYEKPESKPTYAQDSESLMGGMGGLGSGGQGGYGQEGGMV